MYIDTGIGDSNPIMLTLITSGAPFPRMWRIRISQIECSSISRADPGCLQYHVGVYGRIKSFNFDPAAGSQLSNQDYSICIRSERNFCSIQYSVCPDPSKYLFVIIAFKIFLKQHNCHSLLSFYRIFTFPRFQPVSIFFIIREL